MKIAMWVISIILFVVSAFISFACWRVGYNGQIPLMGTSLSPQAMSRVYFILGWASGALAMSCLSFILGWLMDLVKYIKARKTTKAKEAKVV